MTAPRLKLVIGNKAYSSWSLRPWIAMTHFAVPFDEVMIPLYRPETKAAMLAYSPAGKVPVLIDGDVTVWESLAILDYVDETHAGGALWPKDRAARGLARSIATEMHGGFAALRGHCPMNVRRRREPYALPPAAEADVARIIAIWTDARQRFGAGETSAPGPFLFGAFSAADAMYAPVVMRLHFYAIPTPAPVREYMDAVLALPAMRAWIAAAVDEPWVIDENERY